MKDARKLAAIVFTDIVGYTSIMEKNEEEGLNVLRQKRDVLQTVISEFKGQHLKEFGDGDLMIFDSATSAVNFTTKLHKKTIEKGTFKITAAIHLGDVVVENNDVFGSGVNITSRLHVLANPGQTIISDSIYMQIKNKPEFEIKNLGQKKVKGITEKLTVYCIGEFEEERLDDSQGKISFFQDIFSRRVPQFVGIYFAISWGIIQFINWAVDRYLLSPYLIDLSLAISISMIPSILILSYFHGRPGKDQWTQVERIAIPLNAIVSAIILLVLFYPKDLSAVTETVSYEHVCTSSCPSSCEQYGQEISKTIIKSEFRKRYVVFLFNNTSTDTTSNWVSHGIPTALKEDMYQDVYCNSLSSRAEEIKIDMGYKVTDYISLGDKQKISKRVLSEYFITGDYNIDDSMYTINVKLYETVTAKLVSSNKYEGEDFFSLIDLASHQIKLDMEIPLSHLETTTDLPIKEKLTESIEALKYYCLYQITSNAMEEVEYLNKAVAIDESFAIAHIGLYTESLFTNDRESFVKHMDFALKYINKLSEQDRFLVRIDESMLDSEHHHEKKLKIINMWIELYPEAVKPHYMLTHYYEIDNDPHNAINSYKKILEIVPERHENLLSIGDIYLTNLLDYTKSLDYYEKYLDFYPKNPESYERISRVYMQQLIYDKAHEYILKAQALGASGADFELKLNKIRWKLNNWSDDKYVSEVHSLVKKYNHENNFDSVMLMYQEILSVYEETGRVRKLIPFSKEFADFGARVMGPVFGTFMNINLIMINGLLGNDEEAKKLLDEIEAGISMPPLNMMVPMVKCCFYGVIDDWDSFNNTFDTATKNIELLGMGMMNHSLYDMKGEYFENMEDYSSAIDWYKQSMSVGTSMGPEATVDTYTKLGRVYCELGEYDKSQAMFDTFLTIKDRSAELFYEYSILKEKQGFNDEAREWIVKAYDLYKDADKELELTEKIFQQYQKFEGYIQ